MGEEKSLKEEISEVKELIKESANKKPKKFSLPWKARVGNKKMSQGYATIIEIKENKSIDFKKEPIIDSVIKLDDTFHAVNSDAMFFYKGKPVIIQCKNRLNPYNPLTNKNETYGQKYVMARMEGDKLTLKKSFGWGMSIGLIVIAAIIGYSVLFGA